MTSWPEDVSAPLQTAWCVSDGVVVCDRASLDRDSESRRSDQSHSQKAYNSASFTSTPSQSVENIKPNTTWLLLLLFGILQLHSQHTNHNKYALFAIYIIDFHSHRHTNTHWDRARNMDPEGNNDPSCGPPPLASLPNALYAHNVTSVRGVDARRTFGGDWASRTTLSSSSLENSEKAKVKSAASDDVQIIRFSDPERIHSDHHSGSGRAKEKRSVHDGYDSDVLSGYIGHFGRWQFFWTLLLCLFQVPCTFEIFVFVFQVGDTGLSLTRLFFKDKNLNFKKINIF